MKLTGKTVLVTGGSKGIGAATVLAMAKEGANVIINYATDERAAHEVAEQAQKLSVKTLVIQADISKPAEVEAMFVKIRKEFSAIDVLVNNAGIFDEKDGPDNLKAFERIIGTNLLAQVNVTNHARKLMNRGKIIFISSVHGKVGHGNPGAIAYSALKAGLDSYMKNLAKALAPDILVNSVAPGRTLTPMWGEMTVARKAELASGQLINRWIEPSEIADGVVFVAKNDAVCGQVLMIDGGMSLKVVG